MRADADPFQATLKKFGQSDAISLSLKTDQQQMRFIVDEHGSHAGNANRVAGSDRVHHVVGFIVGAAELSDNAHFAAGAYKKMEYGGDAGGGWDFHAFDHEVQIISR